MNADFPRILTLLRKERGISQKQAAAELGISQARLSHYEKGIRECGLDFLLSTAEFYNVSCDYLLGRSPERTGAKISYEDIPEPDALGKENTVKGSVLPTLNKKIIFNALNVIFDMLQTIDDKELTVQMSNFLNLSVYRLFRMLYSINPKNEQSLFTISPKLAKAKAQAAMTLSEAIADERADTFNADLIDKMTISTETLDKDYPLFCSSLLNLIKNSENVLKK